MPKRGNQYFIPLTANGNPAVLTPNPQRTYLMISGDPTAAYYFSFGPEMAVTNPTVRFAPGMPPIEFTYENIGELIRHQLNVWNAGNAGTHVFIIEGMD